MTCVPFNMHDTSVRSHEREHYTLSCWIIYDPQGQYICPSTPLSKAQMSLVRGKMTIQATSTPAGTEEAKRIRTGVRAQQWTGINDVEQWPRPTSRQHNQTRLESQQAKANAPCHELLNVFDSMLHRIVQYRTPKACPYDTITDTYAALPY